MPELAFVDMFELTIKYIEIALPGATSQSTQIVSRSDSPSSLLKKSLGW